MVARIKTIGVLRFSVLTPTFNAERFDSLEQAAQHVFSEDRMALRFRFFEKLCLPSLARQSDPDFGMVILTSDRMPERYLERLLGLVEPLPNMQLLALPPDNHYRLLQKAYASAPKGRASHTIKFRLDDDDALDVDFVKRTKKRAAQLLEVFGPDDPFVIAWNRGFYVKDRAGGNDVFDACERAPLSTGTALVAPLAYRHNPYRFNHRKLAQHYTTVSDISVPAFVRTIHDDNHSTPAQMGITRKMSAEDIDAHLRRHFQLTLADLKDL